MFPYNFFGFQPKINQMTTVEPILSVCPCCGNKSEVTRPFGRNFITILTTAFPRLAKEFAKHNIGLKDNTGFRVCESCYSHCSKMAKFVRTDQSGFEGYKGRATARILVITTPILSPLNHLVSTNNHNHFQESHI
jgi:hypothetical protein